MITTGLRPKSLAATLRRVRHDLVALADGAQARRAVGFSSHVNEPTQRLPHCPVHRKEAMLMFVSIFSEDPMGAIGSTLLSGRVRVLNHPLGVPSRMNLQGKEPHHHFTVILIVRVWTWPSAPFTA